MEPGYVKLLRNHQLKQRVLKAKEHLIKCHLCPHLCGVNRLEKLGFCQAPEGCDRQLWSALRRGAAFSWTQWIRHDFFWLLQHALCFLPELRA